MRVVVGLEAGTVVSHAEAVLRGAGAHTVTGPAPSLPDVVVAAFDDRPEAEQKRLLEQLKAAPGVRYAELDTLRTSY
jgi:hypothetical protein